MASSAVPVTVASCILPPLDCETARHRCEGDFSSPIPSLVVVTGNSVEIPLQRRKTRAKVRGRGKVLWHNELGLKVTHCGGSATLAERHDLDHLRHSGALRECNLQGAGYVNLDGLCQSSTFRNDTSGCGGSTRGTGSCLPG